MIRIFLPLCVAAMLGGCASTINPLPRCDGYSRRPLNRSMWKWKDRNNLARNHSRAGFPSARRVSLAYVEDIKNPHAFAHMDTEASYRSCKG